MTARDILEQRPGAPAVHRLTLLALLLLALGCGGEPPQTESDQPELDRLRSLPYVDSTAHGDEESGVVHHDPERAWAGYTLYTTQMHSRAELIDMDGRVVREWQHTPSSRWERGELLPNGDLIAIGADPSGRSDWGMPDDTRYMLRMSWNGELLWKRPLTAHHDVEPTPDGKLLTLTFERRQIPAMHPQIDIRDDRLTLLDERWAAAGTTLPARCVGGAAGPASVATPRPQPPRGRTLDRRDPRQLGAVGAPAPSGGTS